MHVWISPIFILLGKKRAPMCWQCPADKEQSSGWLSSIFTGLCSLSGPFDVWLCCLGMLSNKRLIWACTLKSPLNEACPDHKYEMRQSSSKAGFLTAVSPGWLSFFLLPVIKFKSGTLHAAGKSSSTELHSQALSFWWNDSHSQVKQTQNVEWSH